MNALTQSQVLELEKELLSLKLEIQENYPENLKKFKKTSDSVDMAQDEIEHYQGLKGQGRNLFYLKKINKALLKIERGEFGECIECEKPILFKRLLSRPVAELCINCKEEEEASENRLLYEKRSKTLGQKLEVSANN